jgi:hypothetical protein
MVHNHQGSTKPDDSVLQTLFPGHTSTKALNKFENSYYEYQARTGSHHLPPDMTDQKYFHHPASLLLVWRWITFAEIHPELSTKGEPPPSFSNSHLLPRIL